MAINVERAAVELAAIVTGTRDVDALTAATLYLSLTTAQGSADTGDVYVYGVPFN